MKNAIIYFYNIYIDDIRKLNNNYYFSFNNEDYVIQQYSSNIKESVFITKRKSFGDYCAETYMQFTMNL